MKNLALFLGTLLVIGALFWISSEKAISNPMVSKQQEVGDFSRIILEGTSNLFLRQGKEISFKIEAEESILPLIQVEVNNGTLQIEEKSRSWLESFKTLEPYNVYVTVKNLEEITLNGKGTISTESEIKGKDLTLNIRGYGKIDFEMGYETLTSYAAGFGEFNLKGKVVNQKIDIRGSSTYNALDLASANTSINIKGHGKVNVNVSESLDIDISGTGTVKYIGQPKITQNMTGLGKVEKLTK